MFLTFLHDGSDEVQVLILIVLLVFGGSVYMTVQLFLVSCSVRGGYIRLMILSGTKKIYFQRFALNFRMFTISFTSLRTL